ncbi:hypothetical protein O3P69_017588 [Scylla paramamosain]|uniref:Uncharacterized protein n=1 Tax=Scylla paramamosain TaxID=85552 RepID=A0AAW0TY01_SCYPA
MGPCGRSVKGTVLLRTPSVLSPLHPSLHKLAVGDGVRVSRSRQSPTAARDLAAASLAAPCWVGREANDEDYA